MRILVTGGTGNVGRQAVERLVSHGHDVLVIGRRSGLDIEGAAYRACDINDFAAMRDAVRGQEGIVHLAAIPNPAVGVGHEIFRVNCSGTFNVFEAAAQEGIGRVVSASSINALGFNYGVKPFPIEYLPVDEEHPTFTTDPYSFSKQVVEDIADYYWRRDGITSISLRLPGVYEADGGWAARGREHRARMRETVQELADMPEAERQTFVDALVTKFDSMRAQRLFERPFEETQLWRDPDAVFLFSRSNFFTNVDARDSAQAIELGLTANYAGSHTLFINDNLNTVGVDPRILSDIFFPGVPWRKTPEEDGTLVSIDKAQVLLGFAPEHHLVKAEG